MSDFRVSNSMDESHKPIDTISSESTMFLIEKDLSKGNFCYAKVAASRAGLNFP